jgi:nucleotide-binding universal stress UspA family protein
VHLLVVTDGSCPAAELRQILGLLTRPTRVVLLAVNEPPLALGPPEGVLDPAPTRPPTSVTERLTAAAVSGGRIACEELRVLFAHDTDIEVVSECGDVGELVRAHAAQCDAQLVVVAGWRGSRLRRTIDIPLDVDRPLLLLP